MFADEPLDAELELDVALEDEFDVEDDELWLLALEELIELLEADALDALTELLVLDDAILEAEELVCDGEPLELPPLPHAPTNAVVKISTELASNLL